MLWISSDLEKYSVFREKFRASREGLFLDLSKVPSNKLVEEAESIVHHHSECRVFLGYLEPGWMLEPTHQTRIRKLFRKFDVAVVTNFVESIPFSWKNEIHTFYVDGSLHGTTNIVDNGSALQNEPAI
jgi:hypothetical protein